MTQYKRSHKPWQTLGLRLWAGVGLLLLLLTAGCAPGDSPGATTPPVDVAALIADANAAYESFDWPRAVTLFEEVVTYQPDVAEWWTRYGWALHNTQQFAKALVALERAEQLDPTNFWNPFGKARAYAALGRLPEAFAALERAIALAPHRPGPHRLRVRLYLRAKDPDRALAAVLTGLYYVPDDPQLLALWEEIQAKWLTSPQNP